MKKIEKLIQFIEKNGIIRIKEIEKMGIPRQYIYRLVKKRYLEKMTRGIYKVKSKTFDFDENIIIISKKFKDYSICLLSALRFYNMTTQNPHEIWVAVKNNYRIPKIDVPMKIIRMSGKSLTEGKNKIIVGNIPIYIYNPAKTVCDCFKFRNKIGLDVALEALKTYINENLGEINELWKYSKINRVQKIIKPYIDSLLNEQ